MTRLKTKEDQTEIVIKDKVLTVSNILQRKNLAPSFRTQSGSQILDGTHARPTIRVWM